MAISVADNFSYQGTKPLDARIKFDTVANMKTFAEAKLYDGCLAYVTGTKKYYSFDSTNTVDPDTGKWREYSTGGSYVLPIASDEVLGGIKVGDNLEIGDDGTLNAILPNIYLSNEISGHNVHSTNEKLIGQWIDGKPLYQKTFEFNSVVRITNDGASLPISIANLGQLVKAFAYRDDSCTNVYINSQFKAYCAEIINAEGITIQYTKSTDSAQAIGSLNDYSTTEKIIGTWIDGKPIYQKTVTFTAIKNRYTYVDFNVSISKVVMLQAFIIRSEDILQIPAIKYDGSILAKGELRTNAASFSKNSYGIMNYSTTDDFDGYVTLQYTKTTD